jgi:hypothetical protein
MKKTLVIGFIIFSSLVQAGPEITLAPVKHLYVPNGFDSNDTVEVVVSGSLPSACHSRNTVKVDVRGEVIDIEVTAITTNNQKKRCPDMIIPFMEVVSVGNLQGGDYQVIVNEKLTENLTIGEASSNSIDDEIYAAIDHIEKKSENEYVLHGWRYSHCIDLKEVKVISNGKDTFSVLPVMKQLSTFCPMKMTPVSYPVKLDKGSLKVKEPLVHVRTMDGKSFNKILKNENLK